LIDFNTCRSNSSSLGRSRLAFTRWRLFAVVCSLLAMSGTSLALDGMRGTSQYLRQHWGEAQGLPGVVHAIAQTPDGYLWIGTDVALLRFDGTSFTVAQSKDPYVPPLRHVLSLTLDARGVLWIWMQGTRVALYQNGVIKSVGRSMPNGDVVSAVARTADGNILFSSIGQRVTSTTGTVTTALGRAPGPLLLSIAQTFDGRIWLGTREGGLYYLSDKNPYPVTGHLPDQKINCLLAAGHGRLWIGTDAGLALWDGTHLSAKAFPAPLDHAQILSLVEDRDGNLWAGTGSGLIRYNGRTADQLSSTRAPVTAVFEDSEANIWFGDTRGIERISSGAFTTWSSSEGLPGNDYGPVFVDAGRTWFAPLHGGLYWLRNGEVHRVTSAGLDNDVVYSIDGDHDNLWLGRQHGGLTHLHLRDDIVEPETYNASPGKELPVVFTVHANRDASVWAGTLTDGAFHLTGGSVTTFRAKDGLASDSVSAIEEGADGAMWFGTPDNGVSLFQNNHWHGYSLNEGLPSPAVTCLLEDRQGVLWVGTGAGLAYIAPGPAVGKLLVRSVAQQSTPLGERILGIAQDAAGWFWISTANHILRVSRDSLVSGNPVLRIFDVSDGLLGTGGVARSRSLIAGPDGRIWISTSSGLSAVNPTTLRIKSVNAHVESLLINGKPTAYAKGFTASAADKRIVFTYTGFNFAAPERLRFRYRLDNFDRDWSDPVPNRTAAYTNLSPGTYRFRVMASGDDGDWSSPEASVTLRITPLFWQTWWFILLCILFAVLVCLLIYQFRMQQIVRSANRRFEERLAERTRIAQELHDTLLQGFFSASMQLHVVTDGVPADSPARPHLDRIVKLIGSVLDDGRNAVRGLRADGEQFAWIEEAIGVMLRDLGNQEDVHHRVIVDGISRQLRPVVQDEVTRIAGEAIGNAFRHAQASSIEVEVRYSSRSLIVEVRDDGIGIDSHVLAHGRQDHWGLRGMAERAAGIGAKLHIANRTPRGTTVTLSVPNHIAYNRYSSNGALNWIAMRFYGLYTSRK
jgi:signal transduction histidine kinase/ligand-binding sensor domain-containing protein